jgi:hypothetical protein
MPAFTEQDLDGATFTRVSLRQASFEQVRLNGATFHDVDLTDATFRAVYLNRVRMRGVELPDLEIHGELGRLVVNGVDVVPLVEAELDRQLPDRRLMRPVDPPGFARAWATVERLWAGTVERARTVDEADLHRSVDGEWSFIQTLRHLGFATACWVGGIVEQDPDPWDPLDLPWDEAPGWDGVPWDRDVQPRLDDVLALRQRRMLEVREVIESLTQARLEQMATSATPVSPDGGSGVTIAQCLRVVLNEEWEHRLYAERDLTALRAESTAAATTSHPTPTEA